MCASKGSSLSHQPHTAGALLLLLLFFFMAWRLLTRRGEGLNLLTNDVAVSSDWELEDVWSWKRPAHINILEAAAAFYLVDSHVSRSAISKGRSASNPLKGMMKTSAAICIAFGIYPAGRFCPTRLNLSDCPHSRCRLASSLFWTSSELPGSQVPLCPCCRRWTSALGCQLDSACPPPVP